jgi:hypothetical protein
LEWTKEDVVKWLSKIQLEEHADKFIENHITGKNLLELDINEITEMGITSVG